MGALEAGQVGQATSVWTKLKNACVKAKKAPELAATIDDSQGLSNAFEFLMRLCEEKPAYGKQAVGALATLLDAKEGPRAFLGISEKQRLKLWTLPVAGGRDSVGSVELAARLISIGCKPDEFLTPPAEVVACVGFASELRKSHGGDKAFGASEVGKAILAADLPDEAPA